jgi:hypothetical protein
MKTNIRNKIFYETKFPAGDDAETATARETLHIRISIRHVYIHINIILYLYMKYNTNMYIY